METTIKQAEEERNRSLENAKLLYDDYKPLKDEVDLMRRRIGLEPLLDVHDEEEKISPEYFDRPKQEFQHEPNTTSVPELQPPVIQMSPQAPPCRCRSRGPSPLQNPLDRPSDNSHQPTTHEGMFVMSSANPQERTNLSPMQSQDTISQSKETKEKTR